MKELPLYFDRDTDPDDMPMEPAAILAWGQKYVDAALDQWINTEALSMGGHAMSAPRNDNI